MRSTIWWHRPEGMAGRDRHPVWRCDRGRAGCQRARPRLQIGQRARGWHRRTCRRRDRDRLGGGEHAFEPHGVPRVPVEIHSTTENTLFAIKIIAGLVVLVVLAYLGGHRKVVKFQERLGVCGVITAGFPFVALGCSDAPRGRAR